MPADKVKVLALAASPRVGGNTDRLMDAFLGGLSRGGTVVEKIYLSRLAIAPCRHCGGCLVSGECVQKDDMAVIYRGLAEADALALASPVYFMGVTAQAKTMIDRCQAVWVAKYRLGKPLRPDYRPGAFISAAGQPSPAMFDCPLKTVKAFLKTTQFKLAASVLIPGLDEADGRALAPEHLVEAEAAGKVFLGTHATSDPP